LKEKIYKKKEENVQCMSLDKEVEAKANRGNSVVNERKKLLIAEPM